MHGLLHHAHTHDCAVGYLDVLALERRVTFHLHVAENGRFLLRWIGRKSVPGAHPNAAAEALLTTLASALTCPVPSARNDPRRGQSSSVILLS